MNKFLKTFFLLITVVFTVSCDKNDDTTSLPLRDYAAQYDTDIENIEEFLKTHYLEVVSNPGATEDMDVTYTKIPTGGTQSSIWNQTTYPLLTRNVTVKQNGADITYKIYYLKLREGSGPNSKFPCNVDRVLTSYNGKYISTETVEENGNDVEKLKITQFEESINPQTFFNLTSVIRGWSEIFPQFSTGSYTGNPDGTTSFFDFGAGVMFIPSGLAYYGSSTGSIPAYSPLIFSFKLYEIERTDQDGDGIPSFQEDLNNDRYMYVLEDGVTNPDNTNEIAVQIPGSNPPRYYRNDNVPDFIDNDDDGDFFTTAGEIENPLTGEPFPFVDIPTCADGKKKHLSNVCN